MGFVRNYVEHHRNTVGTGRLGVDRPDLPHVVWGCLGIWSADNQRLRRQSSGDGGRIQHLEATKGCLEFASVRHASFGSRSVVNRNLNAFDIHGNLHEL